MVGGVARRRSSFRTPSSSELEQAMRSSLARRSDRGVQTHGVGLAATRQVRGEPRSGGRPGRSWPRGLRCMAIPGPGRMLVAAAFLAFTTAANATCQQQCRDDSGYTSCVTLCEGDERRRFDEAVFGGRQSGPAAPLYGAIALSPKTGKGASVWRQPSRGYAEKHVVSFCEQSHGAGDCRAVMWFRGGWCGASAWSTGQQWGSASASTKRRAETKALELCRKNGGRACRIKQSLCSG